MVERTDEKSLSPLFNNKSSEINLRNVLLFRDVLYLNNDEFK